MSYKLGYNHPSNFPFSKFFWQFDSPSGIIKDNIISKIFAGSVGHFVSTLKSGGAQSWNPIQALSVTIDQKPISRVETPVDTMTR